MIVKSLSLTKLLFLVLLAVVVSRVGAEEQTRGAHDLIVTSPAFHAGEEMPVEFTGDGDGKSPPITWSEGPAETKSYAVNLWHTPKDGELKSYWVIYNIPADVTSLPPNSLEIGEMGYNDRDRQDYDPMHSKGPGTKEYHITVHALSEMLDFSDEKANRDALLKKMVDITLANGTFDFQYTRHQHGSWWWVIGLILAAVIATAAWFKFAPESTESQTDLTESKPGSDDQ